MIRAGGVRPGEVYLADFPQAGRRPVIVASREELNRGNYILVVVCTSARFAARQNLPNCVPFRAGDFGLTIDCVGQCENMISIERSRLDVAGGPIGVLDATKLRELVKAIGHVIESDCEPV